ncbi:MAG: hypothetical protein WCX97_03695 [Candidatus Magasanikbacteria bacterium]
MRISPALKYTMVGGVVGFLVEPLCLIMSIIGLKKFALALFDVLLKFDYLSVLICAGECAGENGLLHFFTMPISLATYGIITGAIIGYLLVDKLKK